MTKSEFMSVLSNGLKDFTKEERQEILYDYEEHFQVGLEQGKSENEIIEELGDPHSILKQYKTTNTRNNGSYSSTSASTPNPNMNSSTYSSGNNNYDNTSNNNTPDKNSGTNKALIVILIIALLIFSPGILGLVIGLFGAVFGLIVAAFSIVISGIAIIFGVATGSIFGLTHFGNINVFPFINSVPHSASILIGIGTLCVGILFVIALFYLFKWAVKLIVKCFQSIMNWIN